MDVLEPCTTYSDGLIVGMYFAYGLCMHCAHAMKKKLQFGSTITKGHMRPKLL